MAGKMALSALSSQTHDPLKGMLHARLLLDSPARIHYGSDDPVTGSVTVRYERGAGKTTANSTELFGPLEIDLTLKGTIRIVSSNSAISDSSPQNEQAFVAKTVKLHTGPFRAEPGTEHDFPFSITFPEHADAKHKTSVNAYQDAQGNWKFRRHRSDTTIDDLPPSLNARERNAIVKADMAVRYGLSLTADMPGINIRILNPINEREIFYDRPRVPAVAATMQSDQTTSFKQALTIEHKSFIAPENRSSGLKSLFKSSGPLPKFVFDVICTGVPLHMFIGQPINFNVSLQQNIDQTTADASSIPEVTLNECTISLIAHTRGKKSEYASSHSEEPHSVETLKEKSCDVTGLSLRTPGDVDVGTLSAVPSTFSHDDISREYKLKVLLSFSVMGNTMNVMRMFGVTVHPPLLDDAIGTDVDGAADGVAGLVMGDVDGGGEELPSYDAVMGSGAVTPSYSERQPES